MRGNDRPSASALRNTIRELILDVDLASLPRWKSWLFGLLRVSYVVIRDLAEGQLTLRAMSLVYTTLLSLVPLLAISFSVLKGFGVHNQIEPFLLNVLAPLGEQGVEITTRIIGFVENMRVGVLGFLGVILLFYTVVSLMQKIERAFNFTWHITQERTFAQRFRDYLSVIVVGPVLVFSSLGITASVMSTTIVERLSATYLLGDVVEIAGRLVPYFMIVAAFTFIYIFMPNTKVRPRSALVGGLVAGVLWNTVGWAFASFIVTSTKYTAIYSTFATLIMFMIWLYLAWLILLVGASIAFYDQHPEYVGAPRGTLRLSVRVKEKLALLVAFLVGENFYGERPAWTAEGLAQRLGTPTEAVETILEALERGGLLKRTDDDPATYLPARPMERTEVKRVLDAVRGAEESSYLNLARLPSERGVEELIEHLDRATQQALHGRTLRDLVESQAGADSRADRSAPEDAGDAESKGIAARGD